MRFFKNLFRFNSAFSMIEIMIGLVIVAVAIVPIIGVMSSGHKTSGHEEAMVQAADYCRNIMDTLLNDVRFKCLLPGGLTYAYVKNQLKSGGGLGAWPITGTNVASNSGNPTILSDATTGYAPSPAPAGTYLISVPGGGAADKKYTDGLLHEQGWDGSGSTPKWTYRDERGTIYYINVCVRVVPVLFRYLNTTEYSNGKGNCGTSKWGLSYFPDETKAGAIDYVFGDEPVDSSNGPGPNPLWLAGDVPDSRIKKIVVSVFWKERGMGKSDILKSYSLISFKAKLED